MIEFNKITGLEKISETGTADIYYAPSQSIDYSLDIPVTLIKYKNSVWKDNETAKQTYLKQLWKLAKEAPSNVKRIIYQYTIWPQQLVCENGSICGYVSMLLPDSFKVTRMSETGREITHYFTLDEMYKNNDRKEYEVVSITPLGRAKIVHDILLILSNLHIIDVVVGDFSQNSVLISIYQSNQAKNRVLFIDMDSVRIIGTVNPFEQPHTEPWVPPECQSNGGVNFIKNKRTDVYKACLAILRLYHKGTAEQKSSVRNSPDALDRIRKQLGDDFANKIASGLSNDPSKRPTSKELYESLAKYLSS